MPGTESNDPNSAAPILDEIGASGFGVRAKRGIFSTQRDQRTGPSGYLSPHVEIPRDLAGIGGWWRLAAFRGGRWREVGAYLTDSGKIGLVVLENPYLTGVKFSEGVDGDDTSGTDLERSELAGSY